MSSTVLGYTETISNTRKIVCNHKYYVELQTYMYVYNAPAVILNMINYEETKISTCTLVSMMVYKYTYILYTEYILGRTKDIPHNP